VPILTTGVKRLKGRGPGGGLEALAHDTDILYSVAKTLTTNVMNQTCRYVFRPARPSRPAPALLRRIWAWF